MIVRTNDDSADTSAFGSEVKTLETGKTLSCDVAKGKTEVRDVDAIVVEHELSVAANDRGRDTRSVEDGTGVDFTGETVASEGVEGETVLGHRETLSEVEVLS